MPSSWERQVVLGWTALPFPGAVRGTPWKSEFCRDVQAVLCEEEGRGGSFTEELGRAALCGDDG